MSKDEFKINFDIKNEDDINKLVYFVSNKDIDEINQLKIKASITKHLDYNYINFTKKFSLESITPDIIGKMFENIENRILIIEGEYDFLIIHRVSDNKIFKSIITDNN